MYFSIFCKITLLVIALNPIILGQILWMKAFKNSNCKKKILLLAQIIVRLFLFIFDGFINSKNSWNFNVFNNFSFLAHKNSKSKKYQFLIGFFLYFDQFVWKSEMGCFEIISPKDSHSKMTKKIGQSRKNIFCRI